MEGAREYLRLYDASLMPANVQDMAAKNMTLTVQTGNVSYNLSTNAIDTKAIAESFSGADPGNIPFNVTIADSSIKVEGADVIIAPVEFTVTAVYGGR